jgi:hypothetical protein
LHPGCSLRHHIVADDGLGELERRGKTQVVFDFDVDGDIAGSDQVALNDAIDGSAVAGDDIAFDRAINGDIVGNRYRSSSMIIGADNHSRRRESNAWPRRS